MGGIGDADEHATDIMKNIYTIYSCILKQKDIQNKVKGREVDAINALLFEVVAVVRGKLPSVDLLL